MLKKIIRGGVKIALFVVGFIVIIFAIQPFFLPQNEGIAIGSVIVNDFNRLPKDSVDVLFLGASECFCTINAVKLTDEYGISSYDFGASDQKLMTTYYYLQEALKDQKPKLIMVEICQFFYSDEEFGKSPQENEIAWNYYPMRFSLGKFTSMYERFHGDAFSAIQQCFFPMISFHTRWNTFDKTAFSRDNTWEVDVERGFLKREEKVPVELAYTGKDAGRKMEIPQQTCKAILDIVNLCQQKEIEVAFFKAPAGDWTRNAAKLVELYMQEHGFAYLELNDYLNQIGIDPTTDFFDRWHLNISGANKTTDFIAQYLMENYQLGQQAVQ